MNSLKLKELQKYTKELKILYVENNIDIREPTLTILKKIFNNIKITEVIATYSE